MTRRGAAKGVPMTRKEQMRAALVLLVPSARDRTRCEEDVKEELAVFALEMAAAADAGPLSADIKSALEELQSALRQAQRAGNKLAQLSGARDHDVSDKVVLRTRSHLRRLPTGFAYARCKHF